VKTGATRDRPTLVVSFQPRAAFAAKLVLTG